MAWVHGALMLKALSAAGLPMRAEHLIRPAVIYVLNDEVGLVRPVVMVGGSKARSQGVKVLKPMSPLSLTFP
jgi:hypothetical protein